MLISLPQATRNANQFLGDITEQEISSVNCPTKYSYVLNSPLTFTDPSGFEVIEEIVVTAKRPEGMSSGASTLRPIDFVGSLPGGNGGALRDGGESATAPTSEQTEEREDINGCDFNYVDCEVTVEGTDEGGSIVSVIARIGTGRSSAGLIVTSVGASLSQIARDATESIIEFLEGDAELDAEDVFKGALGFTGVGGAGGYAYGLSIALAEIKKNLAKTLLMRGGIILAAEMISSMGTYPAIGLMVGGGIGLVVGIGATAIVVYAYNTWYAD